MGLAGLLVMGTFGFMALCLAFGISPGSVIDAVSAGSGSDRVDTGRLDSRLYVGSTHPSRADRSTDQHSSPQARRSTSGGRFDVASAPKKRPGAGSGKVRELPSIQSYMDEQAGGTGRGWRCEWSPTMNWDWHDDALCTNGAASRRPYLLPYEDFVDRPMLMAAARRYAGSLNGGR